MVPVPEGGPGVVFERDIEMVGLSDLVLAFFAPYHAMEGGTGHVVEVAIDRNVPVYSYTLDDETLTRVGDHDPEATWQPLIKEYFDQPSPDQ
jgi:nucleoside 2-deoxyribosyltransferase